MLQGCTYFKWDVDKFNWVASVSKYLRIYDIILHIMIHRLIACTYIFENNRTKSDKIAFTADLEGYANNAT